MIVVIITIIVVFVVIIITEVIFSSFWLVCLFVQFVIFFVYFIFALLPLGTVFCCTIWAESSTRELFPKDEVDDLLSDIYVPSSSSSPSSPSVESRIDTIEEKVTAIAQSMASMNTKYAEMLVLMRAVSHAVHSSAWEFGGEQVENFAVFWESWQFFF